MGGSAGHSLMCVWYVDSGITRSRATVQVQLLGTDVCLPEQLSVPKASRCEHWLQSCSSSAAECVPTLG